MGKINIASLGGLGFSENTSNEYDNEVTEDLLDHHLSKIASIYRDSEGYVCYVFGMGAQPKSTYEELKKKSGIEVIWSQSILSSPFKVLSLLIASHAGLIKILDPNRLPNVTKKLCHLSMAGIYIFNKSMEEDFVARVLENPLPERYDFGIKEDEHYFLYIVDADNEESSTGIYEIVSYGKASNFSQFI